ncbi:MAG: amidophosphoribosyltransferase, partial [Verrucomicrobiales bacterium]|nr:amidophosphoribosyltransferase [Verrucomicrobiales bacterium]
MSDPISHECGIAFIRLLKPVEHYIKRYGTPLWGFQKLFLLMEKQHNRGQDGVGVGCTKLEMPLGRPYMFRERDAASDSLGSVFNDQLDLYNQLIERGLNDPRSGRGVKQHFDYGGELLMGHLRYGTSGSFALNSCHPYIRRSNWPTKTLMVAGNFNMTN